MSTWRPLGLAIGLWLALAPVGLGTPARADTPSGPSFDCARAQDGISKAVCASPDLAAADRTMAALYAVARVSAFGSGPSDELAAQRAALKDMRACIEPSGNRTTAQCLRIEYAGRNNDLAIAAAMRSPDLALPVIRQTDPAYAPVLEAVQLWASEPEGADWSAPARAASRARILGLLRPFMADLLTKDDESLGREILTDSSGDGIAVERVEDVLISERHFAAFLNVLGPYIGDEAHPAPGTSGARTLPCAAIVRHPALLAATGSVFGSSMDNFVLNNDCAQTLPPTPALAALDGKLSKAWPECEGTIRFAAYRAYQSALDAARLGLARHDPKVRSQRRRGVTPADIDAARAELATYYATYLRKPRTTADAMAGDALDAVLSTAQECE